MWLCIGLLSLLPWLDGDERKGNGSGGFLIYVDVEIIDKMEIEDSRDREIKALAGTNKKFPLLSSFERPQ